MSHDPKDSPMVRQVLYTNDAIRMTAAFVASMVSVCDPKRLRVALEHVLLHYDNITENAIDNYALIELARRNSEPTPNERKN